MNKLPGKPVLIFFILLSSFAFYSCSGMAASAEEYFSIGMAFYDLGKYEDAEKWLNRARTADRTMTASQYNLGRIAFETEKYEEAARHFEDILRRDPDNVLALRAAAYTRIRTGDIALAERHYNRLLFLVPESADDGYNHALVLFAMERFDEAEKVIEGYPFALAETGDITLLYARIQKALDKVEAIDTYARWLSVNTNARVRYEYAQLLEQHELYARALEEYRKTITEIKEADKIPVKNEVRFALARLLLIADGENTEGITELEAAIKEGFSNMEKVEELQRTRGLSAANRDSLRTILNNMQRSASAAAAETAANAQQQAQTENTSENNSEGGSN